VSMNKFSLTVLCLFSFNVLAMDSPFGAISNFYAIDSKVSGLKERYNKETDQNRAQLIADTLKVALGQLYPSCLAGEALKEFQDNLTKNFCVSCGDVSFYAIPPAKIIKKQFVAQDQDQAIAEIIFSNNAEAIFHLIHIQAGWRIEKIEGNYADFGD
jgi:hypothetical protein